MMMMMMMITSLAYFVQAVYMRLNVVSTALQVVTLALTLYGLLSACDQMDRRLETRSQLNNLNFKQIDHLCKMGGNRNSWVDYQMGLCLSPWTPQLPRWFEIGKICQSIEQYLIDLYVRHIRFFSFHFR